MRECSSTVALPRGFRSSLRTTYKENQFYKRAIVFRIKENFRDVTRLFFGRGFKRKRTDGEYYEIWFGGQDRVCFNNTSRFDSRYFRIRYKDS